MRGMIPRLGVLGVLALSMVGCGAPAPTQNLDAQRPASNALQDVPTIQLPDRISADEMEKGEEPDAFQTQQRRPYVRWRRSYYGGRPYYVPYHYYYWYPRPYYRPYYSGPYGYYHDRPGFRHRRHRYRY